MKTKTVLLRGVEIGAGRPKIIVPIVGKTEQEILDKAAELVQAQADVVEWRVDYFQGVGDVQRVVDTARELNEALGEDSPSSSPSAPSGRAAKRRSVWRTTPL